MKTVAMFNNKGGVGKTTLLCNLAAILAIKYNKKILIVDCDPQCNTTQLILGEDPATVFYDTEDKLYTTVYDLLKPIQEGDADVSNDFVPAKFSDNRFKVDLIPGHPRMSFLEDKLSFAWSDVSSGEISGYRKTNWVKLLTAKHCEAYDFIFFDVGPSLGALNRSVLLGCDNFITPMGTDIFSILGLKNITEWLLEAIRTYEHGQVRCNEKSPGSLIKYNISQTPEIKTGFIGYTLNQYLTKYKEGVRVPTTRFEEILKKVPAEIEHFRLKFGATFRAKEDFKLGDVPHLYSLIPLAQTRATPIISLVTTDGIVGSQYNMVKEYEKILSTLAINFLKNIEKKEQL